MTIKEYIKIHTPDSFINKACIDIKPCSLYCSNRQILLKNLDLLIAKEKQLGLHYTAVVSFFSVDELAKKIDFSTEIDKVEVNFSNAYSYDDDIVTTFYIADTVFLKLVRNTENR